MTEIALTIERARPEDAPAIDKLHQRAFGPGRFARTAFRVREQAGVAEGIGYVARVGSLMVGSVMLTPIMIGTTRAFMLGPLTVEPSFEGRGIGAALLQKSADAARAIGAGLIVLVGDEAYYKRHGYRRVPFAQITLPGPVDPSRLLALELQPGTLAETRGLLRGGV